VSAYVCETEKEGDYDESVDYVYKEERNKETKKQRRKSIKNNNNKF